MLSSTHSQAYSDFSQALLQFRERIEEPNVSLKEAFASLQDVFQLSVMSLTEEGLEPSVASGWQLVQTEIYRGMRLLQTDILLLQAARQAVTLEQRKQGVRDRLTQLLSYCDTLLSS